MDLDLQYDDFMYNPLRGASASGASNAECSSQSIMSGVGSTAAANDYNDMSKKAKLDSSSNGERVHNITNRSRVVHLRNIPSDMTDVELIHLCIPFGKVTNFLLLKGKNQAFVEYEDETGAMALVAVSNTCPIALRGRTIFCQFSNHQELKTDNKNAFNITSNASSIVPAIGTAATQVQQSTTPNGTPTMVNDAVQHAPNSVLRVIIENMIYPVTLDVLHSIFTRFGKVLRIITFSKNNTFQALIQLDTASGAQVAKQSLDGQNVYNGCCTLRIDYSKLATLNVKYNNDKSRDYTNPNLPSGELTLEQQLGLVAASAASLSGGSGGNAGLSQASTLLALQQAMQQAAAAGNTTLSQLYAQQLQQQLSAQTATSQSGSVAGAEAYIGAPSLSLSSLQMLQAQQAAMNPALAGQLRTFPQLSMMNAVPPVVLVSNLHEDKVTTDALFTLFGVYGDVQRVKILFNKKDNALVQYAEPGQAQLAIQHLDKVKLWGKQIRVAASKHNNVQMPKEGQPDAGLTKDYSQSPLHRFKKPGSKNYMNIYPPSATLHLSNIPPNITEQYLMEAFKQAGYNPIAFKFFPKDHKMALMQMSSTEEAVDALIAMHNYKLADNAHLRVSFSKSGI